MKNKNIAPVFRSISQIFIKFGLRDVDANILAILIFYDREMAADEIRGIVNYSISATTMALHRLMRAYLVSRTKRGKKFYYRPRCNMLCTVYYLISEIQKHEIPNIRKALSKVSKLEKEERELMDNFKKKLDEAEKLLIKIMDVLKEQREVME